MKSSLIYYKNQIEIKKEQFLSMDEENDFVVNFCPNIYGSYEWQNSYIVSDFLEIYELYEEFRKKGIEFREDHLENEKSKVFVKKKNNS